MTPLPIAHGSYLSESLPLSAQECVNWYPHVPDVPALAQEVLFGVPGISSVALAGGAAASANRGSHAMEARYFNPRRRGLYILGRSFDRNKRS